MILLGSHGIRRSVLLGLVRDYAYARERRDRSIMFSHDEEVHERYTGANRHDRRRWLRGFLQTLAVAHDALIEGRTGAAIGLLAQHVTLEQAMALVYEGHPWLSVYMHVDPGKSVSSSMPTVEGEVVYQQTVEGWSRELQNYPHENARGCLSRWRPVTTHRLI